MDRILSTLHAPAPPSAQNHARVVDYEKNSEDAPCASAAARPGKSFKCCKNLYSRQIDAKRPRHGGGGGGGGGGPGAGGGGGGQLVVFKVRKLIVPIK